jgi:hypothetical protein
VLLAIPLLTIPCYVTGFVLLAAGAPVTPDPELATATSTATAQPIERATEALPTWTVEPPTDEPTSEPVLATPTEIVVIVTATLLWTETPTAAPATATPLTVPTETATPVLETATAVASDTPPPTPLVPIETETPSTP